MAPTKAEIENISVTPTEKREVLFNPTEISRETATHYAEHTVPGLQLPILQYVHGQSQTLSLELFLDRTKTRQNIEDDLAWLRKFVKIDGRLHAPPVCSFHWGQVRLVGVVTSLRENLSLFDEEGNVIRARVTMNLKKFKSAEVQWREPARESSDRTRVRIVRQGETIAQIAYEAYGDSSLWRHIAAANGIERPRFLTPGMALRIPALKSSAYA